ncbi:hypothetical protein T492DRAFT_833578 [Pavlovales sp. CCMP2436]|nr:hypothetical protein T492DRAFT_833578 [Pavlovales sp. CCMP2436]
MEKVTVPKLAKNETHVSEAVTEETAAVSIAPMGFTASLPIQETTSAVLEPKPKRATLEKQRMNYLAANARRVQILAEAKEIRVAAALEVKRQMKSIFEYELAVRLAHKYGFNPALTQATEGPVEPKEEVNAAPPALRYQVPARLSIRFV